MRANIKVVPAKPVSNFIVTRDDGHTLSLSSNNNSFVEFDATGQFVVDHTAVYGGEVFLSILAQFLGYRIVPGLWDRLADSRALLVDKQLWERKLPAGLGGGYVYQVTSDGASPPTTLEGLTLAAAMRKGGIPQ